MDGKTLTQIVDRITTERGISRLELCNAIGITSGAYTNWKKGGQPREDKFIAIEKFLNINLSDYEKLNEDEETAELLQQLKDRNDLRVLLNSAKDVPPSSVYALVAQLEKEKEDVQ